MRKYRKNIPEKGKINIFFREINIDEEFYYENVRKILFINAYSDFLFNFFLNHR